MMRLFLPLFAMFYMCPLLSLAQIEWKDYPYPLENSLKDRVLFGYLSVPETRNENNRRDLKIGFCVLKSSSTQPLKDAVIFLPGGPGEGLTDQASYFLAEESMNRLLEERDIVLFDPRGCGTSEPQLCGNLENPEIQNASLTGISNQEYYELLAKTMRKCRDSLIRAGVNVESYGSSDIASDIDDLRIALGYEKWNLRGHSYGTRYAQSVIRQYPEHVRSAVLSGVVPSSVSYEDGDFYGFIRALRLAIDQCSSDKDCNASYPHLEENLLKLLHRVQENPIVLPPGSTPFLPKSSMVIGPKVILGGIFQAMYSREGFEMVPLFVDALSKGEDWIANALAFALSPDGRLDFDMFYFIKCNDNPGVRFTPRAVTKDSLVSSLYSYWVGDQTMTQLILCKNLSIELDSVEQLPVRSQIPVLLFSGEFDPITPPYYMDSVAKYLPNSVSFVVPGRGHDTPRPIADVTIKFFNDPTLKPDIKLVENLEPAQFLTRVHLNKGISSLSINIVKNDYLSIAIILGAIALIILLGLFYFTYQLFAPLLKRNKSQMVSKKYLLIWILVAMCFIYILLLYLAIKDALDTNFYLLMFGLHAKWSFLFYSIWLILLALVLCCVFSKGIWSKSTSITAKTFWSLSLSSAAGLVIFLLYWGVI